MEYKARMFLTLTFYIRIMVCVCQCIWYLILLCQTRDLKLHIPSVCNCEFFINYSNWNWIQASLRWSPIVYLFSLSSRSPTIQLNLSLLLCFLLVSLAKSFACSLFSILLTPSILHVKFNNGAHEKFHTAHTQTSMTCLLLDECTQTDLCVSISTSFSWRSSY